MADNKQNKNPFVTYTEEEVAEIESGNYFIQIGDDVLTADGKMAFNKERAEFLYDDIFKNLTEIKVNGTLIEQADATSCLKFLKMHKMRVH